MTYFMQVVNDIDRQRKNNLMRFFDCNQVIHLSHWAKNAWFQILTISLFGEISENTAVELVGHEMVGPCTIAFVKLINSFQLIVADKVGFSKVELSGMKPFQLERMAGLLRGRIFPADIDPKEFTYARQQTIIGELEALEKTNPELYLAGV